MTRPLWPPDCGPLVFGILEQVEERPAELQIEVLRFDGAWVRAGRDRVAVRRPRLVVRGDREVVGGPERVVGDEHRGEFLTVPRWSLGRWSLLERGRCGGRRRGVVLGWVRRGS